MEANRPLRLCLIIPTLDRGGAEKQLTLLACGLDKTRFDVHVVVLTRTGPRQAVLDQANVPVHFIGKSSKIDIGAYRRLRKLLRELKPDIVHTWLFAANAYGRFAAIHEKVPVVLGGERSVDPWKKWYELWIDRYLAKRSRAILTNSNGVKDFYASKGIPSEKFVVIPNGVEVSSGNNRSTKEEVSKELDIPVHFKWIAAVGRLWPQKGYKDILWAMELIRVANPETMLVIFGEGPMRQRLEHYRDQIQIAPNVRFVGERSDVADLLQHFDLFVNGSLYEGQSNSILEAMSTGLPVVASDIPGNRDLIAHGKNGLLFPLGDPYQLARFATELLIDPEKSKVFGSNGSRRIQEEFSIEQLVKRHEDFYSSFF